MRVEYLPAAEHHTVTDGGNQPERYDGLMAEAQAA